MCNTSRDVLSIGSLEGLRISRVPQEAVANGGEFPLACGDRLFERGVALVAERSGAVMLERDGLACGWQRSPPGAVPRLMEMLGTSGERPKRGGVDGGRGARIAGSCMPGI